MHQLDQAERSGGLHGSSVVVSYFLVCDDRPSNYLTLWVPVISSLTLLLFSSWQNVSIHIELSSLRYS